jgi:predicted transcriptional regulator
MRTTTIRLADRQAELLDELARIDRAKGSDVLRAAVRNYINYRAAQDPEFAAKRDAAVRREVADNHEQIRATFGEDALSGLEEA